jgi:elongation factor G
LHTEFGLEVNVGNPQVVYRETISQDAEAESVFEREIAGKDHYAAVSLRLEPGGRGTGNSFDLAMSRESVGEPIYSALRQGAAEAAYGGVLMGYPVVDVGVTLLEIQTREGQVSDIAAKAAFMSAYVKAMRGANPILLEPIMSIEVVVPEEYVGSTVGDLNARRGKLTGITPRGNLSMVDGEVPLAKMFGYSRVIRTLTQGRGTFSMQFSHFKHDVSSTD